METAISTNHANNKSNTMNAAEKAKFYAQVDQHWSLAKIKSFVGVHSFGASGKSGSAKTLHTLQNKGVYEYIVYLTPHRFDGHVMCPNSENCKGACLAKSGRERIWAKAGESSITRARRIRTELFLYNRPAFVAALVREIELEKAKAEKLGSRFIVRLNGTSDISYQSLKKDGKTLPEIFPDVQFVEYTKVPAYVRKNKYANVDYTFSFDGANGTAAKSLLSDGLARVAVVFAGKQLPGTFAGFKVVDGDLSDVRCDESKNVIVGLRYKRTRADVDAKRAYPDTPFIVKPEQHDF